VELLEKLKEEKDLKNCTFKPNLLNSSRYKSRDRLESTRQGDPSIDTFERLYKENIESKNLSKIEQEKAYIELKHCTFSPAINNRKSRSSSKDNGSPYTERGGRDPFSRLFEVHKE
jgi:hypothetical protein